MGGGHSAGSSAFSSGCCKRCVCQGINSIHAQTARFNIPTVLLLLQTMSSGFHALQVGCP